MKGKGSLKLMEISSGLARQSESLNRIRIYLKKLDRLIEDKRVDNALVEISKALEVSPEVIREFIGDGLVNQVWDELTYSTASVKELGEKLEEIVKKFKGEEGSRLQSIKELL
jgi:hypothetical protein